MPVLPTESLNYEYLAATKDVWSAFAQAKDFWYEKRSFEAKPNIQVSRSLDENGDLFNNSQVTPFCFLSRDEAVPDPISQADAADWNFLSMDAVTQSQKSYKDAICNSLSEQ